MSDTKVKAAVFWRKESKNGLVFYSGKDSRTGESLVMFENTNKRGANSPDLTVYLSDTPSNQSNQSPTPQPTQSVDDGGDIPF